MTSYWPFWLGGLALAGIALLHALWAGQLMSVSSRFSALVDRARGQAPARPDPISSHVLFLAGFCAVMLLVSTLTTKRTL